MPSKSRFECEACCKKFSSVDYHLVDDNGIIALHSDEIEELLEGQEWGGLCDEHANGDTYFGDGLYHIKKGRTYAPSIA